MNQTPDYYATLHIPHDASGQQISRAYRALMRNHHPDMTGGRAAPGLPGELSEVVQEGVSRGAPDTDAAAAAPPSEAELLQIMQAFAVLRDTARRAEYDRAVQAKPATRAAPPSHAGTNVPVRKVRHTDVPSGYPIRITPVRWESGPWA